LAAAVVSPAVKPGFLPGEKPLECKWITSHAFSLIPGNSLTPCFSGVLLTFETEQPLQRFDPLQNR
jgi:hypothetical protein